MDAEINLGVQSIVLCIKVFTVVWSHRSYINNSYHINLAPFQNSNPVPRLTSPFHTLSSTFPCTATLQPCLCLPLTLYKTGHMTPNSFHNIQVRRMVWSISELIYFYTNISNEWNNQHETCKSFSPRTTAILINMLCVRNNRTQLPRTQLNNLTSTGPYFENFCVTPSFPTS